MSSDAIAVCPPLAEARSKVLRRAFLSARWQLLAMLNWEVEPALVEPLVPRGCVLDFHGGRTFVSAVGFLFLDARVIGVPVPGHRDFEEVNLRFYVRRDAGGEIRRGVAFIREVVPRWAIAQTARFCYNEPYIALPMGHEATGPAAALGQRPAATGRGAQIASGSGSVAYWWRFRGHTNRLELSYAGQPAPLARGSHEEFIAEHYFGYCRQRDGGTVEYQVEHLPWKIWPATSAALSADVAELYGPQFQAILCQPPTTAFLADGSTVAVMRPLKIS